MVKKLFHSLVVYFALQANAFFAQHADCKHAISIAHDSIYTTKELSGYGTKLEYDGNSLSQKTAFEKENHSIWYIITMPNDGIFTFDIIPENLNADWDFLLYPYNGKTCEDIASKNVIPIRSNLSRSATTGLSHQGNTPFVGAGVQNNYSMPLKVKKEEQYLLVVNNTRKNASGHQLHLHYPKKPVTPFVSKNTATIGEHSIELFLKEKDSQKPIVGFVNLSGLEPTTIERTGKSSYAFERHTKNNTLIINACAKGYLLYSNKMKINTNKPYVKIDLPLEKIAPGKRIAIEHIQFHGNKASILSTSTNTLEALYAFMEQNPTLKIEIEGHVNAPGKRNLQEFKSLSQQRAETVKQFVVDKGIDASRIVTRGYGNAKMIFPSPRSERERIKNRRVEIVILEE